jgi:thymidine phosphorylase
MCLHRRPPPAPTALCPAAARESAGPSLQLRRLAIDTWRENVAYLHRDCAVYRAEGFQALSKVEVRTNGRRILAVLNVVDDPASSSPASWACRRTPLPSWGGGRPPGPCLAGRAARLDARAAAQDRRRAPGPDLHAIIRDIAQHRYSKIELAAFVVATNRTSWTATRSLPHRGHDRVGRRLDWGQPVVVDKHCIGGIPGNRTSMLVVPIVAAHGMLCPKTSSRAITSPAGTADTMEVLARVELPFERLRRHRARHHGCLAWGGTAGLSPADDVLISVERPLSIDSPGQMVASILSKKIAAGSTHLVLDIPVGPTAKVRSMPEAQRLRRLFEYVARRMRLSLDVVITDGASPSAGHRPGAGGARRDAVLQNDPEAPRTCARRRCAWPAG